MQDEGRLGDDAVAALLLHARQSRQEFVGDVFAEPGFAESRSRNFKNFRFAARRFAVEHMARDAKARDRHVVDFPEVVIEALDLQPLGVGRDHFPGSEIVERGAPQHGLLAAGIHRDIAADAGGVGRGRIARENQAGRLGRFHRAPRHHARAAAQRRHGLVQTGQHYLFDGIEAVELFGIDHGGQLDERDRAAGIAGAAAARDDREPELDARLDDERGFLFGIGMDHHERVLDAPVGGIGDVRYARQAVELDIVAMGDARKPRHGPAPQPEGFLELGFEGANRGMRGPEQFGDTLVAIAAPRLDAVEPAAHAGDQRRAPLAVGEQVVLDVGIARHHPDIAQHFVEHFRRAPGAALVSELVEDVPQRRAQQPDHDLAVGERSVVVGDFPQAGGHFSSIDARKESILLQRNRRYIHLRSRGKPDAAYVARLRP